MIVKVDADNQIVESDENNNILVSTTPFTVTSIQNFDYCVSKSITPWELWVSNVKFVSINNTSEKFKDYATLGYSDYTNLSTPIQKGQMYQLSIAPGMSWIGNLPNAYCRVWIDFNNNKIFEDSELVFQNTNVDPFVSAIRIPLTASTGNVRMRISVKLGSYPTACETFDIGEVEDYLLQITEGGDTTGKPDLVSNISATAALYKQWTNDTFKISLKNTGNQVFTDIKMQFSYPPKTATGGMATPSMGIWQEYCAGGSRCFMWTIPSIEANSTATLHVPLYVLDATGVMSATTKLLSSTPIDNIVVNNTATVTLNPVPMSAPQPLVVQKALHLKPLSIQPTISADMVFVEIESLIEKTVDFTIFNTVGKPVQREKYTLEKGYNRLTFDIAQLPKGLYFIQPATNNAQDVPLKFIKM